MSAPSVERDESRWSSRYYRHDCPAFPDVKVTMKLDGPDDRRDPDGTTECFISEHGLHGWLRISPAEWERLTADDEPDDEDDW
ncbi:hypothetical protein [Actinomycetospora aeridis]|uniref:Uncharacterized protein n=1 Tax=Actinomycetospora aeridis TaxID=3129231 RepID=A0ABU8N1D2_9PSEU